MEYCDSMTTPLPSPSKLLQIKKMRLAMFYKMLNNLIYRHPNSSLRPMTQLITSLAVCLLISFMVEHMCVCTSFVQYNTMLGEGKVAL